MIPACQTGLGYLSMYIHLNCVCSVGTDLCKTTILDSITWAVFSDQSRDDFTNDAFPLRGTTRLGTALIG